MIQARDSAGRVFWTIGDEVVEWIEEHCRLTDSVWVGQPFRVMGWWKARLYELFEVVEPATRRRRYRAGLIGTPRKNAKSEHAAAIALYRAFGTTSPAASVYEAAASDEQAGVVHEKVRRMVELSPTLSEEIELPQSRTAPRVWLRANPYQYIERLSAKGSTKHGLNPGTVILDELHAWIAGQADELYQALTTAMAAQPDGLLLAITTAGSDLDTSRCGKLYRLGRAIEAGEADDPTFYFRWEQAPEGCDHRDPAAWRVANPALGTIMDESFYRSELVRVPEADFRRLYLNQWVEYATAPWVTAEQLEVARVEQFELDEQWSATWVGVDLAETRDTAAVAWGQWWKGDARPCGHTGEEACLALRARVWEAPLKQDGSPMPDWEVPHAEIREFVRELNGKHRVLTNVFDPWHGRLLEQDLQAVGLKCERIWQSGSRRAGASAGLHELVVDERLHWCDEVVRRHFLAARQQPAGNEGGYYLTKAKKGRPMDVAMAAVNVVYGFTFEPEEEMVLYIPGKEPPQREKPQESASA